MSSEILLKAEKREVGGSSVARRLRREGKTPAVVYGVDYNQAIALDTHEFAYALSKHSSEHILVQLDIEGEVVRALIKEVQHDEITGAPKHADMQKVVVGQAIHTTVPVVVKGEAAGTKVGGVLEVLTHELDVEFLPRNAIESIVVDVTDLDVGAGLTVADVNAILGENYKVLTAADTLVVHVVAGKVAEAEETAE